MGAFYPFSRNHNTLGAAPQELYLWPTVAEASRKALGLRYRILPYLYTLLADAHFQGTTVAHAPWMVFPEDLASASIDSQFMLGKALLISPVITEGQVSVNAYFPPALWYPISSTSFNAVPIDATAGGKHVQLSTPLTEVNVHVRGGSILPLQDAALTTTVGRTTPFTLLVALCQKGGAFGTLFWDDGEQIAIERYLSVEYTATADKNSGSVSAKVIHDTFSTDLRIQSIVVLGPDLSCPTSTQINGAVSSSAKIECTSSEANPVRSKIVFSNTNIKLSDAFTLSW